MTDDTARKKANQFRKALRFAAILDALCLADNIDPHENATAILRLLEKTPEQDWTEIAVSFGQRPLSDETKEHVFQIYKSRELAREMVSAAKLRRPAGMPLLTRTPANG